ncbi:MAG: hypothetical protein ACE5FA_12950 [Dehalococcoidia bacterium]
MIQPRYPVFVPTKGRANAKAGLTARVLRRFNVPFHLVVEPQEAESYAAYLGDDRQILVLPFRDLGQGSIPARNWIKDYATAQGYVRHWQLDDNIRSFFRRHRKHRIPCSAGLALRVCEDFTDRYANVAVSGLNYKMFGFGVEAPPFRLNAHVYSCTLVLNEIPHRWRGRYNEDTDLCLQVLADGWCTLQINAFLCDKMQTMTHQGGNTDQLYQEDGRAHMARSLERVWPGVVDTRRRFGRPQHVVKAAWQKFDNRLIRNPDFVPEPYEITLRQLGTTRSKTLRRDILGDPSA